MGAAIFRILVGAELETYFEDLAKEALTDALAVTAQAKNSHMFGCLMALYKADKMGGIPAQFGEIEANRFSLSAEVACIHAHRRFVDSNQGFKSHNVLKMFVPIGIDETKIPEQLFIDLDALASRRGDVAHNALGAVINIPNPQDDKELVFRIIEKLKDFESALP